MFTKSIILISIIAIIVLCCTSSSSLVSATPGQLVWNVSLGRGLYAAPTSTYNTLYIGDNNHYLTAVDLKRGNVVWQFDAHSAVQCTPSICRFCAASPNGVGTMIYGSVSPTNTVYSNGLAEGYLQWKFQTNGSIYGRPYIHNNYVIFGSYDNYIYSVNRVTGKLLWKFNTGGPISASPQIYGQYVIVGNWDHKVFALSTQDGHMVWTHKMSAEVTSACAKKQGANVLFCSDNKGMTAAIDLMLGKTIWTANTAGAVQGRPRYWDDVVYLAANGNNGIIQALNSTTGVALWTYNLANSVGDGFALHNDKLYFGDQGGMVHCLFTNNTIHWKYQAKGAIFMRPLVEDYVYIGDSSGNLYKIADY